MKKQFNLEAALNGEPFECEDLILKVKPLMS